MVAGVALAACARPLPPPPPPVSFPPIPPPIISPFGDWQGTAGSPRRWQHYGIDIRVPVGTLVLAAADGTVLRVNEGPISGKMIVLAHSADLATSYNHLSVIAVKEGQRLRRGEAIGRSGMTGNASTPHLHFGVCRRPQGRCGNRISQGWDDPVKYWVGGGTPCYTSEGSYPAPPLRLTYPVPCQ